MATSTTPATSMTARNLFPDYPFSDGLYDFMDAYPDFLASLKLSKPARFDCFRTVVVSRVPEPAPRSEDDVIGIWYLDRRNLQAGADPLFKQDFVVDVGRGQKEFVSYGVSGPFSSRVRRIHEFFRDYGDGTKYYHRAGQKPWEHHYADIADLPEPVREEGSRLKAAALRRNAAGGSGAT